LTVGKKNRGAGENGKRRQAKNPVKRPKSIRFSKEDRENQGQGEQNGTKELINEGERKKKTQPKNQPGKTSQEIGGVQKFPTNSERTHPNGRGDLQGEEPADARVRLQIA